MAMKPWYKVVTPREDLREGRPLDAAEFAVHLDHVRDGRAGEDYQDPARFFARTFLTKHLTGLASAVIRRLSGETIETSAVFNMATQFGGGKTHALTLLYHLAQNGSKSTQWAGVRSLLERASVSSVPEAATAVFVGTEFDSIQGRGGDDDTPKRLTPWGEMAFQLSGPAGFAVVESHDREGTAPAGDVIRAFLPKDWLSRGILRLLPQWVSHTYQRGFRGAQRDGLIGLGTAPLDDPLFRRALFEQLGEDRLEGAITTDIIGKPDSFALRLDAEAVDTLKKARLHQKVATTIFIESSGGQQHKEASLPEIRFAVAEPGLDLGNIETVLEELESHCYFLTVQKNRYRFSLTPNLNKLLSDRRANIRPERIEERVREAVQRVFARQAGVERVYFPERSNQVPDRPAITMVVLAPDRTLSERDTRLFIEQITREYGASGRTYKSALIWSVADSAAILNEEARKLLAWEEIDAEESNCLDEAQRSQITQNRKKAQRDLQEAVWRSYKNIALLGRDNQIRLIDLGLIHSSAADSLASLILSRLRQDDEAVDGVNPNFLIRNWPPALTEWSTQAVRDAFFASPKFPRLLVIDKLKETIARGVANGVLAYAGRTPEGRWEPFFL